MKPFFLGIAFLATFLSSPAWGDLTGRWSGNDGGTYYLRQEGDVLYWYGEAAAERPSWSNVFVGRIHEGRIEGNWTDVPKGRATGSGTLELVIEKNGSQLRVVRKSVGFSGSRWTRMNDRPPTTRAVQRLQPSSDEDCARFDPDTAAIRQVDGRWRIVDDGHWLFDFGSNRTEAENALRVIRRYRMNRLCPIGSPDPSFVYMLAKGGIPSGPMDGENCQAFDAGAIHIGKVDQRWMIVEGGRGLLDVGSNSSEARQTLAAIRRHGFSHVCFAGRSRSGFTYLRR